MWDEKRRNTESTKESNQKNVKKKIVVTFEAKNKANKQIRKSRKKSCLREDILYVAKN